MKVKEGEKGEEEQKKELKLGFESGNGKEFKSVLKSNVMQNIVTEDSPINLRFNDPQVKKQKQELGDGKPVLNQQRKKKNNIYFFIVPIIFIAGWLLFKSRK
jgi:hypothetical protein